MNYRPAIRSPSVTKLKIRLGDYLALSRYEQALHIVELLDQDTGSGLRNGINRFQVLLEGLGLKLELEEPQKKVLFEFQMVRNNLAHRNGVVDRRLLESCPWLGVKLGQSVKVSRRMLNTYSDVAGATLLNLLYSTGDIYGINLRRGTAPKSNT